MPRSPYPGLRPFTGNEADVFFGRETHVDTMVDRLGQHRLLAVTGSSGSGKSSLVQAGLLRALEIGLLAEAGSVWRFAQMRPRDHPMAELAAALIDAFGGGRSLENIALQRAALERGLLSLVDELREHPLADGSNLLILVDQFEEIFRYQSLSGREEAEAFVSLLLASAGQREVPIYVVLTMRSDFLGRCAEFDGLAEAVTDAQYLCPRMGRDQIVAAIEGPAGVFGGRVEPRLVAAIVNDMGTDPDQLPLMQHALMRLWEQARAHNRSVPLLRLGDYVAEGGLKGSLSRHADEILAELTRETPERAATTRRLFCLLTEGEGDNAVRRLTPMADVMAVASESLDEIRLIANAFRAPGRSLLMPPSDRPLNPDTILDISHESLIRQWQALKDWVREEAISAEHYRDAERRARRWQTGDAGLWDSADLDITLAWRDRERPSAAWAARYGGDFHLAMQFLDESRAARDAALAEANRQRQETAAARERELAARRLAARTRIGLFVMSVLLVIAAVLAWLNFERTREAAQQREEVRRLLADAQRNQSRFLTTKAREALHNGNPELAGLIAREALPAKMDAPDRPMAADAVSMLSETLSRDPERAVLLGHQEAVLSVVFSPDGQRILTTSTDKTARLWDARSGAELSALRGHYGAVNSALFSPDGQRIVTASVDRTARVWDARSDTRTTSLEGHQGQVYSAAFSPNGQRIVTASEDNTARIWDARTGAQLAVLTGHTSPVQSAAFSPDSERVVTASSEGSARLWDAQNGTQIMVLPHQGAVYSALFSRDGQRVLTASQDRTARLWDARTGVEIASFTGHEGAVLGAKFSPDGSRIVTWSDDSTARLWKIGSLSSTAILRGHEGAVVSATFAPDGKRLATTSIDGTARLWDADSGVILGIYRGHDGEVSSVAFSPDSKRVVTASKDRTARLWDARGTSAVFAVLQGHTAAVVTAEFSPDGQLIVTASSDKTARLWDAHTGDALAVLQGHEGEICCAVFSPDGRKVATGSKDNTARLWDANNGAVLAVFRGHTKRIAWVAFSPDGQRLVTASWDDTARLWGARSGVTTAAAILRGHEGAVYYAAFSPDGQRIVTASQDRTARLWDARTGAQIAILEGHQGQVYSAVFSPDGQRIVTSSEDKTARVWEARTGAQIAVLSDHVQPVWSAVFSPDGKRIATTSWDKTARVWDALTGEALALLQGHGASVRYAAFSPDGQRVLTASADKTARVWDVSTGTELALLQGHEGGVWSAAFGPDGERIVTGSADDSARVWGALPLKTNDTVTYADMAALRILSEAERSSLFLSRSGLSRSTPQPLATSTPNQDCDALAADRLDPHTSGPGLPFETIDPEGAVDACRAAVEAAPSEQRFRYQLGRALARARRLPEAAELYRAAAQQGYPAAVASLGDAYQKEDGVTQDATEAMRLFRQAAEGGFLPAYSKAGWLYWSGAGVAEDREEALRWYEKGAELGDPFSHRRLAELCERGEQGSQDLEKALFHHAIETELLDAVGEGDEAHVARARRGSDARALAPEVVVRVAKQVATWRARPR